eukprot:3393605-Pleurochrysis_carterae.AAC.1
MCVPDSGACVTSADAGRTGACTHHTAYRVAMILSALLGRFERGVSCVADLAAFAPLGRTAVAARRKGLKAVA